MKKNDGGPAFPNQGDGRGPTHNYDGMTLREYYAGQAMLGLLANPESSPHPPDVSSFSVIQADALIAELEEESDD